jgi:hypothetical protein
VTSGACRHAAGLIASGHERAPTRQQCLADICRRLLYRRRTQGGEILSDLNAFDSELPPRALTHCASCHAIDGRGMPPDYPPLAKNPSIQLEGLGHCAMCHSPISMQPLRPA